jgi:hypothetical protein
MLFWADPYTKDQQQNFASIRPILSELRMHAERAMTLIAAARAAAPGHQEVHLELHTNPTDASLPQPDYWTEPVDPRYLLPSNPTTLRETDAIDALELGARRMDFIGLKFQLADEMTASYNRAIATAASSDRKAKPSVAGLLGEINGVNGRIQDIKDGYSLIRDLYAQSWLRTNRAYALRPVLEHYDYTIGMWLSRMDKMRSAQRQWSETRTLPSLADAGFYAPPPPPVPEPVAAPVKTKKAKKAKKQSK